MVRPVPGSGWRKESAGFRRSGPGAPSTASPRPSPLARGDIILAGGRAIRELPATERPRERLALRGAGGLSAAELIALLWGSGSRGRSAVDLAGEALARHDGLTGLARATDGELEALPGVGPAKAAQLTAA